MFVPLISTEYKHFNTLPTMIRKFFAIAFSAVILASCGNSTSSEAGSTAKDGSDDAVKVEFASLIDNPGNYIDQNISVEGKVVHVCTMSGKKMFIVGENPDIRLFISAGEDMPKFPMELLGSEIVVEGKLTRATAAAMMEGEGMGEASMVPGQDELCETEEALSAQPVMADLMMVYSRHKVK